MVCGGDVDRWGREILNFCRGKWRWQWWWLFHRFWMKMVKRMGYLVKKKEILSNCFFKIYLLNNFYFFNPKMSFTLLKECEITHLGFRIQIDTNTRVHQTVSPLWWRFTCWYCLNEILWLLWRFYLSFMSLMLLDSDISKVT